MIYCPYAVDRHLIQQTTYEYDDSGNITMNQVIEHNTAEFVQCKENLCGAWQNGRCFYGKQEQN